MDLELYIGQMSKSITTVLLVLLHIIMWWFYHTMICKEQYCHGKLSVCLSVMAMICGYRFNLRSYRFNYFKNNYMHS